MRLRYGNGFSISLWSEEIQEVLIFDSHISYRTPSGQTITIQVPKSWIKENSSLDDESDESSRMKNKKDENKRDHLNDSGQNEALSCRRPKSTLTEQNVGNEIQNLKKMIEDLNSKTKLELSKADQDIRNVLRAHDECTRQTYQDFDEVREIIERLSEDNDDYFKWRTAIEDYLQIDPMNGPTRSPYKSGKRGRRSKG